MNVIVLLTGDPHAIVVPATAVQASQQGQYAFVVKADRSVEFRTVVVDRASGDVTVVKSGFKPGETVVTDGHLRLVPCSRFSIKGSNAPKATS